MDEMESLSHTKWECRCHVVFIPKCRRKTLYGELRRHLGEVPHAGGAEGESDRRRAFATGSRRHDDRDSTEVRGVPGGGFHQGQECDSFGPGGWRAEAKFCGPKLSGPRQRPRIAALCGSQRKASGSAGGYLLIAVDGNGHSLGGAVAPNGTITPDCAVAPHRAEAGIGAVAPHCAVPPHSRISPDRRIAPHGGVPPHRRGVINKTDGL